MRKTVTLTAIECYLEHFIQPCGRYRYRYRSFKASISDSDPDSDQKIN